MQPLGPTQYMVNGRVFYEKLQVQLVVLLHLTVSNSTIYIIYNIASVRNLDSPRVDTTICITQPQIWYVYRVPQHFKIHSLHLQHMFPQHLVPEIKNISQEKSDQNILQNISQTCWKKKSEKKRHSRPYQPARGAEKAAWSSWWNF